MKTMRLQLLDGDFSIIKLPAEANIPEWAMSGSFVSVTRTADELSIVARETELLEDTTSTIGKSSGWKALKVEGPLDFELVGVLESLARPLAREGVSVFTVSTYDTDYLLLQEGKLEKAIATLSTEGHEVA